MTSKANMAPVVTFKVQAQAINFYLSHKTHYVGIAEKQGTYTVIPRSK